MKKIITLLILSFVFYSCANLFKKLTLFEICMDCLYHEDYNNAIISCQRATMEEPSNYSAFTFLGVAYAKTGQLEKSLESLNQAIQIEPDYYYTWKWKGVVLQHLGRDVESKFCIEKSKELETKSKKQK